MSAVGVVGVAAALVVLVSVLRLVLLERLRVRYAGLWLVVGAAVFVLAVVPGLLDGVSGLLGFTVPANLLFTAGLVLLLLVGIHLSVAVTSLEDRVQRLAEELALLVERESQLGREPDPGAASGSAEDTGAGAGPARDPVAGERGAGQRASSRPSR